MGYRRDEKFYRGQVMKPYSPPVLSDYGSIAESTFATPGSAFPVVDQGNPPPPGGYLCTSPQRGSGEPGTKNTAILQCDRFGEFSHS